MGGGCWWCLSWFVRWALRVGVGWVWFAKCSDVWHHGLMTNYKDPYRFPRALRAIQIKRKNALTDEELSLLLLEQQGLEEKTWGYSRGVFDFCHGGTKLSDSVSWSDLENHECRQDELNSLRWGIPKKEITAGRHRSLLAQAEHYGINVEEETRKAAAPYLEALGIAEQFADATGPIMDSLNS